MANTYPATVVTVSGLPGDPTAELYELNVSHGERWGEAVVGLPESYAFEHDDLAGTEVSIALAGTRILRGHVVRDPSRVSFGEDMQELRIADLRWEMSRVKIGQYGVGPLVEGFGGFEHVGLKIVFNPHGYGNRSAEPTDDVYTFASLSTASRWTLRQMLDFILYHYYPNLLLPESMSSGWDAVENDVYLYLRSVPQAITYLAKKAGESWALRYDGDDVYYQPVGPNPSETVTINLPEARNGALAGAATPYSALEIEVSSSIVDSADRVEIHSANIQVEALHASYTGDPALPPLLVSPIDLTPKGYARMWIVDVTQYELWNLGKNLTTGSKPKRWMRQNLTRLDPANNTYLAAGSALLRTRYGRPMLPEECCWVNFDNGTTKHRLLSGLTIRFDQGVILLHRHGETTQGAFSFNEGAEPDCRIWITLTTELELPVVYKTTLATYHIDASHPITVPIYRSEIVPQQRFKALLPDFTADGAAETLERPEGEVEEAEEYVDITPDFEAVYEAYAPGRLAQEKIVVATMLDVPALTLGARLAVSPANANLTGDEIVTEIHYNIREGAFATVYGTNNFARLLVDDT